MCNIVNVVFDDVIKKSKILVYNLKQNLLSVYITLKTKSLYITEMLQNITLNFCYKNYFCQKIFQINLVYKILFFPNFLLYFIHNIELIRSTFHRYV